MIEGESSIGRSPERKSEQPGEEFTNLFGGFCQLGIDKETEELQYGPNTPQDEAVLGTAIRLNEGEINLEDEEQKEEIKEFLDKKEKEYRQEPEELLKIRKLRWLVREGKIFLENDLRDEIDNVLGASDKEELERVMDKASSAYREAQGKPSPYEAERGRPEKREEEKKDIETEEEIPDQETKKQTLGKFYVDRPGSNDYLTNDSLRELARTVDAGEISLKQALSELEGIEDAPLRERNKLRNRLQGILSESHEKKPSGKGLEMSEEEKEKLLEKIKDPDLREVAEHLFEPDVSDITLLSLWEITKDKASSLDKESSSFEQASLVLEKIENLLEKRGAKNLLERLQRRMASASERYGSGIEVTSEECPEIIRENLENQYRVTQQKDLSPWTGASFMRGSERVFIRSGAIDLRDNFVADVTKEKSSVIEYRDRRGEERSVEILGRRGHLFESYFAASNFITQEAAATQWKTIGDSWVNDFNLAVDRARIEFSHEIANAIGEEREKIERERKEFDAIVKPFEKRIKAYAGIFGAARAMEISEGDITVFGGYLSESDPRHLDLGIQDRWADMLLTKDPEKIDIALGDSLVRCGYEIVSNDMGIERSWLGEYGEENLDKIDTEDWDGLINTEDFEINTEDSENENKSFFNKDSLPYFLEENAQRGGIRGYLREVLVNKMKEELGEDYSRHELEAAGQIALDIFLTDGSYTQWEYNYDKEQEHSFATCKNWGGDPFRFTLEPSILPRRIKGSFPNDSLIMKLIDKTFRPEDKFFEAVDAEPVQPTATSHFKHLVRLNRLIMGVLGNSFGEGLADFSEDTIRELGGDIAELTYYLYGRENSDLGALMMGKIIDLKASTLETEWSQYGMTWQEALDIFMGGVERGGPTDRANEVIKMIFGPNRDGTGGLLAQITRAKYGYRLSAKRNRFSEAEEHVKHAGKIVNNFGVPEDEVSKADRLNQIGRVWDIFVVIGEQTY